MNQSIAVKQPEHDIEPVLEDKGIEADTYEDELNQEEERMRIDETMQIFGSGLQTQFDKQVGLKEQIEQRWLDDLRHYNGVYDKLTQQKLSKQEKGSKIFVNLTRSKSNTAESKWADLVLPTDDRNWGIKSTPVPEVVEQLQDDQEIQTPEGQLVQDPETGENYKGKDVAEETLKQSNKAAELMQDEIDDQLTEAGYNITCRQIIHNAVVMGTGVIKGPMVERRAKRAWLFDGKDWALSTQDDYKPTAADVDPWNFFPDMSATKWEDCEFSYERHLMTKKQIRKLAKNPGFLKDQLAKVLQSEPNARGAKLSYLNELREISGIQQMQHDNRYEVLEYHGPIDKDNLLVAGCKGVNPEDPLTELEGTVWLCMGIVIKVALNHMDSDELPYSVLNWEEDDTSVFGFGVPYRMRAPQKVMNASWRMVLDNAGLSTGPQILINKKLVEPANGSWELSPRKVWWMTSSDPKFRADYVMQTFDIDSKQQELTAIFEMAHRLADEETSVPQMQMGNQPGDQQQPAMLKTLGGTALYMASNNIMMRRAVKGFDDNITVPFITRFYDFNMQFSKRNEIKGDYQIDARGTSVLLVREMQSRNIMEFITAAISLPGGADELKPRGVLKNLAKGMSVSVDDVMRTDAESEAAKEEAKDNPPSDPEADKLQMQMQLKQMEIEARQAEQEMDARLKMTLAESERQVALIKLQEESARMASTTDMDMQKFMQGQKMEKYKIDWSVKSFFEEMKLKQEEGPTSNYGLEK